jgi:endonuclease/exonuclease/phosphatase (EEP) superfamily protein YafD
MVLKALKKILIGLAFFLYTIILVLTFLNMMDHLNFIPTDSFFYGIDFLPATWLIVSSIIPLVALLLLGYKKTSFYSAIIFLLFFFFFGDLSLASLFKKNINESSYEKVSVVALNVQYYSGGLERVIDTLKNINADFSIISENVLNDEQYDLVKKKIAPNQLFMGHANSTAIISKYPFIDVKEIELPSHEASLSGGNDINEILKNPHRSFVHAIVSINGTKLNMISIRFIAGRPKDKTFQENIKWGKYLLETQIEEVRFFKSYLSKLEGPIIYGGDLNAPAGSKVIRELNAISKDAVLESNLFGAPTFRTSFPTLRIDYIYSMNGVIAKNAKKLSIVVSDHFPIYAEFFIPKSNLLTLDSK